MGSPITGLANALVAGGTGGPLNNAAGVEVGGAGASGIVATVP